MGHNERISFSNGGKLDVTLLNLKRHDIKFGFSSRVDDLKEDNFTILYDEFNYPNPTCFLQTNHHHTATTIKKHCFFKLHTRQN